MNGPFIAWVIGVAAVIILLILLLTQLRNKALEELRSVLYEQGNAGLYLQLLENPHLKLIFSKRALEVLKSEGVEAQAKLAKGSKEKGCKMTQINASKIMSLSTEARNPRTLHIDEMSTLEALEAINDLDAEVAPAVRRCLPSVAEFIDAAHERMEQGGRLIYLGAGTSGRLGVLDASECPPTYGVTPDVVVGLIAGGHDAMFVSQEGVEDKPERGAEDLEAIGLTALDSVVGLAASGRTPYVIGGLDYARKVGALAGAVSCVAGAEMSEHADIAIECPVGPEAITGSTRMRAGTAEKLICNMISTELMVKAGKVYSNLMVDVQATNQKLVVRGKNIIAYVTGCTLDEAGELLEASGYSVKVAIVMALAGKPAEECQAELVAHKGNVAQTIKVSIS